MTTLIIFLALGASLLLLMLVLLLRRPALPHSDPQALVDARHALTGLQQNLLPPELVQRVFARQDLDYVTRSAPVSVQQLFLDERRKVALLWVRQVRKGVMSLRAFHRSQARHYARLNLSTEMALALNFWSLLLACRALEMSLYFRGAYAAPQILGRTVGAAANLCRLSEKSLGFLSPEAAGSLPDQADQARI